MKRCLIVCPGSLVEQWQGELDQRFHLPFEILTCERINNSRMGNPFQEHNLLICRLDQLSRNDDIQEKLRHTDWDIIVCDEAHKMSASFFSGEVRATKPLPTRTTAWKNHTPLFIANCYTPQR